MKVKICGLTEAEHVKTCVNNNTDFCGFILNYPKSHRFVSFDKAKDLTSLDKKKSKFVGVLVNPQENELKKFSLLNIDYFQLYGSFSKEKLIEIKEKYKKKIIISIQVAFEEDIDNYKNYKDAADIILFDSRGYEKSLSWNYNWVKNINITKMIGGNINEDKLENISKLADIVDVSGALETNKVKDLNKIKSFLNNVKKINNEN